MYKSTLKILSGIILILLIIVPFGLSHKDNPKRQEDISTTTPTPLITTNPSVTPTQSLTEKGVYQNYNAEALSQAKDKNKVLFFYAAWCPSCRQQDANLTNSQDDIPTNLAIFKVDFDQEIKLRQKYGVTIQHTFVEIDNEGNEVQQWNSLYQDNDLKSIVDKVS